MGYSSSDIVTSGPYIQKSNCPPVEPYQIFPAVGPWSDGPDVGPCSSVSSVGATSTYTYDAAGRLESWEDEYNGHTVPTYDAQGRLTSVVSEVYSVTYTYSGSTVAESVFWPYRAEGANYQYNYYQLDASGRPVSATSAFLDDGTVYYEVTYEYVDCLIVRRQSDFGPDAPQTGVVSVVTYNHDSAGRVLEAVDSDGSVVSSYDYSCWTQ